tara:strand:- start:21 stop:515 length:495 start_codon:yes stop_codon:yes gene_type:complete
MNRYFIFLYLIIPSFCFALENKHEEYENWEFIVYDKEISFYYIDPSSIEKKLDFLVFKELVDYPFTYQNGEKSRVSWVIADCDNKNLSIFQEVLFQERGGKGKLIKSNRPEPEWIDVSKPKTVGNHIISVVCQFQNMLNKINKIKTKIRLGGKNVQIFQKTKRS